MKTLSGSSPTLSSLFRKLHIQAARSTEVASADDMLELLALFSDVKLPPDSCDADNNRPFSRCDSSCRAKSRSLVRSPTSTATSPGHMSPVEGFDSSSRTTSPVFLGGCRMSSPVFGRPSLPTGTLSGRAHLSTKISSDSLQMLAEADGEQASVRPSMSRIHSNSWPRLASSPGTVGMLNRDLEQLVEETADDAKPGDGDRENASASCSPKRQRCSPSRSWSSVYDAAKGNAYDADLVHCHSMLGRRRPSDSVKPESRW